MATSGIYIILNVLNNKVYVGSAVNIRIRWLKHRSTLIANNHDNRFLQSVWNKYGEESFRFEVIELVSNKTKLLEREQYWLDQIKPYDKNNGYNLRPTADSQFGFKHSKETILKIRNKKLGLIASDETKLKMSKTRKGRKQTPEWIAKRVIAYSAAIIKKNNDIKELLLTGYLIDVECSQV